MSKFIKMSFLLLAIIFINTANAIDDSVYSKTIIKTYTLPHGEAYNKNFNINNYIYSSSDNKAINTKIITHNNPLYLNKDYLKTQNLLLFRDDLNKNGISTHNELLELIKQNAKNISDIDYKKLNFLLNLLKIDNKAGVK